MMAFLALKDYSELTGLVLPIVVISLSMSIPIVAIVTEHLQKQARMRLIAKAIEHGANLEDLKLEDPDERPRLPYRSGMVMIAVGVALILANRIVNLSFGALEFPLLVGGLITGCVGLALLLNDWLNRGQLQQPGS